MNKIWFFSTSLVLTISSLYWILTADPVLAKPSALLTPSIKQTTPVVPGESAPGTPTPGTPLETLPNQPGGGTVLPTPTNPSGQLDPEPTPQPTPNPGPTFPNSPSPDSAPPASPPASVKPLPSSPQMHHSR